MLLKFIFKLINVKKSTFSFHFELTHELVLLLFEVKFLKIKDLNLLIRFFLKKITFLLATIKNLTNFAFRKWPMV
jgi:hypothetical protein